MEGTLGEVRLFAGNFAPRGWAFCDGQLLAISSNTALFSILGTNYGGDGRTTFGLPDLRGRAPIHSGQGPGLPEYRLGQRGGQENFILTTAQLPRHYHNIQTAAEGNTDDPVNNYVAGAGLNSFSTVSNTTSKATADVGEYQPVNNMQPYLAINYIICLQGVFPSRN
jgi:microcystin-dependent protein